MPTKKISRLGHVKNLNLEHMIKSKNSATPLSYIKPNTTEIFNWSQILYKNQFYILAITKNKREQTK